MRCSVVILIALACLAGCETQHQRDGQQAVNDYFAGNYHEARKLLKPLAEKTDENFVLNNLRLGSASLPGYHLDEAEAAFLRAYEVMNSVGVNEGGRSLGATLVDEKIKIWKGEPFERAMANFYLGLIYYMRHDYGNARAAFENALFKLRDYSDSKDDKKEDYRKVESNFALGYLMLGKCWQRLGDEQKARDCFNRVIDLRPGLEPLALYKMNEESNVLLVIDFGQGPQIGTDFDGAIAGFTPTPAQAGPIPRAQIIVDGRAMPIADLDAPPVDLLALAQDRKWQSIDTIRTLKSAVGTGLLVAGGVEGVRGLGGSGSAQRRDLIAAAALTGAGLLLKATSQADTRHWEMLPRTVFVLPMKLPPGKHDITVDFPAIYGLRQEWRGLEVPESGEATYYFRMERWNKGPYEWPPKAMGNAPS